jgi:hypothetical protein
LYSIIFYSTDEEQFLEVEGVVGESVSLPCRIAPPQGDRVAVILWYRDHHPDALYTSVIHYIDPN